MGYPNFRMVTSASLGCILLSACSRTSLNDDLARAKQYSTIAELEVWLGDPTAIKHFHDLEQRELPDGVTFTDADGNSLGHGEYPVTVQNGREIREYEHPDKNDVRFLVTAQNGRIEDVAISRGVKMIDEPSGTSETYSK